MNLSDIQSDQILTIICRDIQQSSLFGYSLVVVLFAAILGALMSTADSCMLTLSSIVTKDFYLRYLNPQASEPTLNPRKILSWLVVGALSGLAIYMNALPTKPTLVKLLDLKFDMLMIGTGVHAWSSLAKALRPCRLYRHHRRTGHHFWTLPHWLGGEHRGPLRFIRTSRQSDVRPFAVLPHGSR